MDSEEDLGEDWEVEPVVTAGRPVAQEDMVAHRVAMEGPAVVTVVPLTELQVTVTPLARAEDMAVLVDLGVVDQDVAVVEVTATQVPLRQPKHQPRRVPVATDKP